jgi:glutamine cyclotransferase
MSTAHSTQEFQVLDISTLTAPTLLGTVNLGNALNGVVYDQVRDRVYVVGTNNSAEFIVLQPL